MTRKNRFAVLGEFVEGAKEDDVPTAAKDPLYEDEDEEMPILRDLLNDEDRIIPEVR
jgi:hypothetical protein